MANPNPKKPPAHAQFKPGESGNPGGKAVGVRNRITTAFLYRLAEDFDKHGKKAIENTRINHPDAYVKVCAGLLPKQIEQTQPLEDLNDADVMALLEYLRTRIAQNAGAGTGEAGESQKAH